MKKQSEYRADDYQAMPVVHQPVAGIDIGSQFHVVAVGDDPKTHLKQFGVSTSELFRLGLGLTNHQILHVSMEATEGYEKPLVNVL